MEIIQSMVQSDSRIQSNGAGDRTGHEPGIQEQVSWKREQVSGARNTGKQNTEAGNRRKAMESMASTKQGT